MKTIHPVLLGPVSFLLFFQFVQTPNIANAARISGGVETRFANLRISDITKHPECQPVPLVEENNWLYKEFPDGDEYAGHPFVVPRDATSSTLHKTDGTIVPYVVSYSCPKKIYDLFLSGSNSTNISSSSLDSFIVSAIKKLFYVLNLITTELLALVARFLMPLITEGTFIRHNLVVGSWPFIQGFANLGFIFALLYIALATTLRLESLGTSIQRLLPKLLIGALLVNFSLVIGGLVIDTSRLFMAAEIKLIAGPGVTSENLGKKIVDATGVYEVAGKKLIQPNGGGSGWDSIFTELLKGVQNTLFVLILTIGLVIIFINFFVRYIALLILLIFSPMAYLALALPQTQKYFHEWWSHFLKWVMYGPIVLFFLVIIVKVQSLGIKNISEATDATKFSQQLTHFFVVAALLFIGHNLSKKAAGAGSGAVMSFAAKNKRTAAAVGLAAATGGMAAPLIAGAGYLAGRYGARGAANVARDFGGDISSKFVKKTRAGELFGKDSSTNRNIPSRVAKWIAGPERDDKGKRKPGEQGTVGSWAADKISYLKPNAAKEAVAKAEEVRSITDVAMKQSTYINESSLPDSPINPAALLKKTTATELSEDQIKDIVENGTKAMVKALVSHKDVVRKMDSKTRNTLLQATRTKSPTPPTPTSPGRAGEDWSDVAKQIDSRIRDLANEK